MTTTRIGFVVPELRLEGGVKNAARFILAALEELPGVQVEVASLAMSSTDTASTRLRSPASWARSADCISISAWGRPVQHYGARFVELEFMRFRERPLLTHFAMRQDLIAVVAGSPSWAIPFMGLDVPIVLTTASLTRLERQGSSRIGARQLGRAVFSRHINALDERALVQAHHVVVLNRLMERHCSEIRHGNGLTYAPLAVDTDLFHPAAAAGEYILFVGRFSDPRKNVGQLVRAYRVLRFKHGLHMPIKFAGTGELQLGEFAGDPLVEVIHAPTNAQLAELYRHAFTFALPSREEGFGLVVAEAMASGAPVVSTRCGGPEDLIEHGVDGFLVGIDDDEAMANSLAELRSNPILRDRMSQRAREKMTNLFSVPKVKAVHQDVYHQFIQGRAQHRGG